MSDSTSPIGGHRSIPRGIVAPGPAIQIGVTQGARYVIRVGEPLHVFIEQAVGAHQSLVLSTNVGNAFIIAPSKAPVNAHRPLPATPGSWFTISVAPGVQAGRREEAKLQSQASSPTAAAFTVATFTLEAAGMVFY